MAFQLSPGVLVQEKDLTQIVPSVATSAGAFAGAFQWGPVNQVTTVSTENNLVTYFGGPTDTTYQSFFSAANFLAYGNNLKLVRVVNEGVAKNAVANVTNTNATALLIRNNDDYVSNWASGGYSRGEFAAKYPGALGNSLKVVIADGNTWTNSWTYASQFTAAPNTSSYVSGVGGKFDEMHVLVIDEEGLWTGTQNSILEKFGFVSKASDAKNVNGASNYYKDVINTGSQYVWVLDAPTSNIAGTSNWNSSAVNKTFANLTTIYNGSFNNGVSADDTANIVAGNVIAGYNYFLNDSAYDISLIVAGPWSNASIVTQLVSIAETRQDAMVFVSPQLTDVVNVTSTQQPTNVTTYRNSTINVNSSYAVMDSGWKYQYDRYNDKYRWLPLNPDIAGLCVRTDNTTDPWFSPAGYSRGQIKNVIKLAYNPTKTDRDTLYQAGINPVITIPGQGTVLFGDKTMLTKPSAFDRINVRRLFIALEKAIGTASKFQLFELNDTFTQAQFRNIVEPFLRDVQGRRGITDFKVVCDSTNNTPDVIDANQFRADIYVKPARSINYITLTFVAARSGISFQEIGA
jgi:Phage tail sheath protein subtilisin-like domain/Phage tail sheath C-terminal domain